MMKFFQDTRTAIVLAGSVALIALMTAAPVAPANAQGVPAGLLRLDPTQSSNNGGQFAEVDRSHARIRNAYARSRKMPTREQAH
jgi:hypothetical protein